MKLGYAGLEDEGIVVYMDNIPTKYTILRTCFASYRIYFDDLIIGEKYSLKEAQQFVEDYINSNK